MGGVKMKDNKPAKKSGRPKKFDEKVLLQGVKNYVKKNNKHPELIKVTKVAKYLRDLGLNVTYQDLSRYEEVRKFIENYNNKFKQMIFNSGAIAINIDEEIPIYEKINVRELIKNNKSNKALEEAVLLLNESNEKLTESFGRMQDKVVLQSETIIRQSKEIDELKSKLENIEKEKEEKINALKIKIKSIKEKEKLMARKMAIYEGFANLYHYDSMAEYALYLENTVTSEVSIKDGILDKEKYSKGNFSLKDIANRYASFMIEVDKNTEELIKENEAVLKSKDSMGNYRSIIGDDIELESKDNENDVAHEALDVEIEDMENSLLRLFDI